MSAPISTPRVALLAGWLLAGAGILPAQVLFTVTDLGTLGSNSQATAVNNAGQVVGSSNGQAFIYSGGVMTLIPTLGGTSNSANDINASGQVAGTSQLAGDGSIGGFIYSGGSVTQLLTLGGTNTTANAINDSGAIGGASQRLSDNVSSAVIWSGGGANPTALNVQVNGQPSTVTGLNNSGVATGNARFSPGDPYANPFRTSGNDALELPNFGSNASTHVTRINDAGAVAGTHTSPSTTYAFAYYYPAGSTQYDPLFDFFGSTIAKDLNNENIVVGSNNLDNASVQQAYRFDTNLGEWVGLNQVVDLAASGFTHLTQATGISDNGMIVGYGTTAEGETHAFLLTPTNVVKFWDGNGTTAGLGQVNGTWSLGAGNWTINTTGTAAGNGWTNGSYARFLHNTSDITVTLEDNVSASGILFSSGNTGVTITGSSILTLVNDAVIDVNNTTKGLDLAVTVAGSDGLNKRGSGTLRLSGNNTYTGETVQHGGDLVVAHVNGLGATGAGNETRLSGELRFDLNGNSTINETLVVAGGSMIRIDPDQVNFLPRTVTLAGPMILDNPVSFAGGDDTLVVSGAITPQEGTDHDLTVTVYSATLTGTNTFNGSINVLDSSRGLTVSVFNDDGVAGPLGAGEGLDLGADMGEGSASGRVRYTGTTATSTRTITATAEAIIEVASAVANLTLTGLISGNGALVKDGAGTLSLAAANDFSGGTEVRAGKLHLASGSALGTGDVYVGLAGVLTGSGTFSGNLTVDGHYAPGDSPALVVLPGSLTLNADGYLDFEIGGLLRGTQYDAIDIGGMFTSNGGSLNVTFFNSFSPLLGDSFDLLDWNTDGGISFTNLNLPTLSSGLYWDTGLFATNGTLLVTATAIPEPSSYALVLAGVALLGCGLRRRVRCMNFSAGRADYP